MTTVSFESYADYSSKNYGVNAMLFSVDDVDFYFSYKTLIAIRREGKLFCVKNYWGNTTGKHLNRIEPDHTKRVDQKTLDNVLEGLTINAMLS